MWHKVSNSKNFVLFFCVFWIIFIGIFYHWCFIIFSLAVWDLIFEFPLNWEKAWPTKWPYGSNFILSLFTTSWTRCSCSLFWYSGEQPDSSCLFISEWKKIKASYDKQIILEIKVYLAHDIEEFVLLFDSILFLLKSSI